MFECAILIDVRRVLITALVALAATAAAAPLEMTTEQGVRWVCGGVGVDERRTLAAMEAQANLKLLLVSEKRGGYLADVEVALFEDGASIPRLTIRSDGPICLVRAPAGRYRIEAVFSGKQRSMRLTLGAEAGKPLRAALAFPGEIWDGIWASEEEKPSARQ